jgi:hypothetical protein
MSDIIVKINANGLRTGCLTACVSAALLFISGLIFQFEPAMYYIISLFVISTLTGGFVVFKSSIDS